ncbi:MAG: hypothetical protein U9Q83_11595 [Bacteroidota bacterium]|nr:hypothetical protein [Bacteroidota bacterium]
MKAKDYYSQKLKEASIQLKITKKKLYTNAWFRGITFITAIVATILLFRYINQTIGFSSIFIFITILLILIKKSSFLNQKTKYIKQLMQINQDELKALEYDFSPFYNGEEYINSSHNFSFDVDIFGENSIFQMLNRAFTSKGKKVMAKTLENPLTDASKIILKQKAVEELYSEKNLIQNFLTNAAISNNEEKKSEIINPNSSNIFKDKFTGNLWKIILFIVPIISVSVITLAIINILHVNFIYFYSLFMLIIVGIFIKYINKIHNTLTKQSKIHKRYSELLFIIENNNFKSTELINLQQQLTKSNKSASQILKKYAQLLNALDNRLNFIFAFLSNTLVLWDIQTVRKIEIHNKKFMGDFDKWINVIAEFEVYCSLAVFKFNNPSYIFPVFTNNFDFNAKELGHPLIPINKIVKNDFAFSNQTRTFIITGANMAGKSTFLRTIAVNYILAQVGSVVCAKEMSVHPMNLITSIRISDSLNSDESYFYAELKRLQYIINEIEEKPNTLIIIDEMLRGTNSNDKHKGSKGLLQKLTNKKVISFLATHDVALGDLENQFPGKVKNYCFEAEIENNELSFNYKIKSGISQNLNASFLMKKMNIIE